MDQRRDQTLLSLVAAGTYVRDLVGRWAAVAQIVELESGTEALKHQLTALTQQLGEAETGAKAKETEAESLRARLAETQQQVRRQQQPHGGPGRPLTCMP